MRARAFLTAPLHALTARLHEGDPERGDEPGWVTTVRIPLLPEFIDANTATGSSWSNATATPTPEVDEQRRSSDGGGLRDAEARQRTGVGLRQGRGELPPLAGGPPQPHQPPHRDDGGRPPPAPPHPRPPPPP